MRLLGAPFFGVVLGREILFVSTRWFYPPAPARTGAAAVRFGFGTASAAARCTGQALYALLQTQDLHELVGAGAVYPSHLRHRNPNAIQVCMKSAVTPQIRAEPELRAELEAVLQPGETLTGFVEATVRNAIAFRRVQTEFHARAQAASQAYHQTGVSVPVEAMLDKLQFKLDARRKKLGR